MSDDQTNRQLESGTYEVLRHRLRAAADDLRDRVGKLNAARAEVFGSIETTLVATQRVTTQHNCTPRDLVAVGNQFLFGYNVQFGLKTDISLEDVFSAYEFRDHQFHHCPLDLIAEDRFVNEFHELYRFYKDTRFSRFFRNGPILHMVFQVGKTVGDIKSFKWRCTADAIEYIDNRSDHEVRDPNQHEFKWTRTNRDQHHYGAHPHVSINDVVFVETVGGDLTIKVENNTDTGEGIYAEPVDDPDQTLDDAEIHYAILGNLVLLKIRPYQEDQTRHLIYNAKLGTAMRLDEIAHACVMLPGDQGLIYPGGYYLQTGEFKQFDHGLVGMKYQRTIASPNGEDYLYLFRNPNSGTYVQLRYNLISQTVASPLVCHGQTIFDEGEMIVFKSQSEPSKHHAIQIWQTPFTRDVVAPTEQNDSLLFKIGNKEIVQAMAECSELLQLIDKDDSYEGLYIDLGKKSSDILDAYFWIDDPKTQQLSKPLQSVRETANAAVEEFDKVVRVRRETAEKTREVQDAIERLIDSIQRERFETIDAFVSSLAQLREQRGHALGLKDLRYSDPDLIAVLEKQTAESSDRLSRRCVDYLLSEDSLTPYVMRISEVQDSIAAVQTVMEAQQLETTIDEAGGQLELLTETVSNLRIDDSVKRTEIIDSISDVFAQVNRVRSVLGGKLKDLVRVEGEAEFASQLKLLEQTVAGYLSVSDTPTKCDEYLTKVMVQLEEIEGKFAQFDDFTLKLAQRRDDLYAAFESRKVALIEKRNRRAEALDAAARRILASVNSRVQKIESTDAIAAYFAGDLMVEKVRDIVSELQELDDTVRAEDLQNQLKTVREDAIRQLKDREDLYEDGGDIIRLGNQRFAVNTQPFDLTTVIRGDQICLHLTGTQFFEPITHDDLLAAKELWNQATISENDQVYRAEYLAVESFDAGTPPTIDGRFEEGYAKGVHDQDAQVIYQTLVQMDQSLGLLRHQPSVRSAGQLWFEQLISNSERQRWQTWIGGFAQLAVAFPNARPARDFRAQLAETIESSFPDLQALFPDTNPDRIAWYLFDWLSQGTDQAVVSGRAADLYTEFLDSIPTVDRKDWLRCIENSSSTATRTFILARNWADAYLESVTDNDAIDPAQGYRDELAWVMMCSGVNRMHVIRQSAATTLDGLHGDHRRIHQGQLTVHYHEMLHRVRQYQQDVVPRFRQFHMTKNNQVAIARDEMGLDEFKPRVLTSFVRNQLLDEVYLPLIGDNLAKQVGVAGNNKRTDRMGLLLLISPPGYGKTTLMEYIANRLGLVFMKINGPALGHDVTSLDPVAAPNAAAREEVERLNLALEMGDNVMLYVDDIQHTHPEFLQKFISLCDATRKIEGVRAGKTRTYDLRGRRVAVVMAGNPYTESGQRFQIPDMLSNRADVYNLGEIIGQSAEAFETSYLENCLTSNPVLAPLATAPPTDTRNIIRAAAHDVPDEIETSTNVPADQIREIFQVMKKLLRVRDVILQVNRTYIRSAAQADAYRTEPPFKLQGSYRNMNRIAERVAAVMNENELESLIVSSYEQDAQTLTQDNEANMLKFKELMGILTPQEHERWESIKFAYVESNRLAGVDADDHAGQLMIQLGSIREGLEGLRKTIVEATSSHQNDTEQPLESIRESLVATGNRLVQTLTETGAQLQRISHQQAASPPEQRILVQHKVPRVMADLVKGQFHLMQEWLRTLLSETVDNGRDLESLKSQLESMLQNYQAVEESFLGQKDNGEKHQG